MSEPAGLPIEPLPPLLPDEALPGAAVAVYGLGIEGRDLARYLRGHGARVTAFDTRPAEAVVEAVAELEALGCETRVGAAPDPSLAEEFAALYTSQSVLLHRDPFAGAFVAAGKPVSSMLREFLRRWSGPMLGVTGSSGKTTTTSLIAAMFAAAGVPHIVGGNLGAPLLAQLPRGEAGVWAVLEISHTQLQLFEMPLNVAVVTNVTPNHLDQFSWEGYVRLKQRLVRPLRPTAVAVLNANDPVSYAFRTLTAARVQPFAARPVDTPVAYGIADGWIVERATSEHVLRVDEIPLRGAHNVENVLAALTAARAAGLPLDACGRAIRTFAPVPHRLEHVATIDGVAWYNDSIATAPERTLAAIRAFDRGERLILLLGGREKKLPLGELVRACTERCRAVVLFGEAEPVFAAAFAAEPAAAGLPVVRAGTLARAVDEAGKRAQPGDIVLLSPAGTSFDAYPNFERRGEEFRALVRHRATTTSATEMRS